ncbi:hypothetical protein D3C87_1976490 [compost metagenome]
MEGAPFYSEYVRKTNCIPVGGSQRIDSFTYTHSKTAVAHHDGFEGLAALHFGTGFYSHI